MSDKHELLNAKVTVDTNRAFTELVSLFREMACLGELAAKCIEDGFDLAAVDSDLPAASAAGDCRTVLKTTDQLALLVSALRAFNLDARIRIGFPVDSHEGSSNVESGGVGTTDFTEVENPLPKSPLETEICS